MSVEVSRRESQEAGEASPRRVLTGWASRVLLATVWLALHAAGAAGHPPDFPALPGNLSAHDRLTFTARQEELQHAYAAWRHRVQQHNANCGAVAAGSAQAAASAARRARLQREHRELEDAVAAWVRDVEQARAREAIRQCLASVPELQAQAAALRTQVTTVTQQLQRAEQASAQAQGEERATRAVEVARVREQVHDLTTRLEFLTYQVRVLTTSPSQAASVCPGARPAPPARPELPVPAPP